MKDPSCINISGRCFERHVEEVELVSTGLTSLPTEIGLLTSVFLLDLEANELSDLPAELARLEKLEVLYLNGNEFATLPTVLGELQQLQYLEASSNKLSVLPAEIGNLNSLEELIVVRNHLTVLPSSLGNLGSLLNLDVSKNGIRIMPTQLGKLEQLSELDARQNDLVGIPTEFGDLKYLSDLYLDKNNITAIPSNLGRLETLSWLSLQHNALTTLPTELGSCVALRTVRLGWNSIKDLPEELKQVHLLHLDSNALRRLPAVLGSYTQLTALLLSENELENLPSFVQNWEMMQNLQLQKNKLDSLPTELSRLTRLTRLKLQENNFTEVPSALKTLEKLERLTPREMDSNRVQKLPSFVWNLRSLAYLQFDFNEITEMPSQIGTLEHLVRVEFEGNKVRSIPATIGNLSALQILDLNSNLVEVLPTQIGHCTKLVNLYLNNNHLASLPKTLANCPLRYLYGTGNMLTTIEGSLGSGDLREIRFTDNLIENLPAELGSYGRLTSISLENNRIRQLPENIGRLAGLQFLRLDSNLLSTLPESIGSIASLNTLQLNRNQFQKIPAHLYKLPELVQLEMDYNEVTELGSGIGQASRLRELSLRGNAVTLVSPQLRNATSLQKLNLGNGITCDCRLMEWYPDYLEAEGSALNPFDITTCSSENEYGGAYPQVFRHVATAPCSHVVITQLAASTNGAQVWWEYPYGFEDFPMARPVLNPKTVMDFVNCESRTIHNNSDGNYFAFELELRDDANKVVKRNCFWAVDVATTSSGTTQGLYTASVDKLAPAKEFTLTIRACNVFVRNAATLRYIYGIRSRNLNFETDPGIPTGSPENVSFISATDNTIELNWNPPGAAYRQGNIEKYALSVRDYKNGRRIELIETGGTAFTLNPESLGSIMPYTNFTVTISARTSFYNTSQAYGPPSTPLLVWTCPANMRWSKASEQADCFAERGYFREADGVSVGSCADDLLFQSYVADDCRHEGLNVENIAILPGHWRSSVHSATIRRCPKEEYCVGGTWNASRGLDPAQYCAANHTGPYCFDCLDNFSMRADGCKACAQSDAAAIIVYAVGICLVVITVVVSTSLCWAGVCRRKKRHSKRTDGMHDSPSAASSYTTVPASKATKRKKVLLRCTKAFGCVKKMSVSLNKEFGEKIGVKLRIMAGFYQVLFSYPRTYAHGQFSSPLLSLVDTIVNLRVSTFASLDYKCLGMGYSYYHEILATTVMPLLALSGSFLCCTFATFAFRRLRKEIMSSLFWWLLVVLFLVYPGVSQGVLSLFVCEDLEDADGILVPNSYLRNDFGVTCDDSPERSSWLIFAIAMTLVYPVGVIGLYLLTLLHYREVILDESGANSPRRKKVQKNLKFLLNPYRIKYYWFEAYELGRKLLQTSLVSLVQNTDVVKANPVLVPLISQNLVVAGIIILMATSPYKNRNDYYFAVLSQVLLIPAAEIWAWGLTETGVATAFDILLALEFVIFCWAVRCSFVASSSNLPRKDKATFRSTDSCSEKTETEDQVLKQEKASTLAIN